MFITVIKYTVNELDVLNCKSITPGSGNVADKNGRIKSNLGLMCSVLGTPYMWCSVGVVVVSIAAVVVLLSMCFACRRFNAMYVYNESLLATHVVDKSFHTYDDLPKKRKRRTFRYRQS